MQHYFLGLIYTYKCSSACDICTFSCSPERDEKMNLDDAKRFVREAKEYGIKGLGLTGGEPLLFFDEIVEIAKYAKSFKMPVTITTNCFWAKNYDETLKVLKTLQESGINHIKISADDFHNKYVPYDNIKNVLNAANNIQLKVVLGCTSTRKSTRLKGLLEHIQDEAAGTILLEQKCYPLGRAKECLKDEDFIYKSDIGKSCRDKGMLLLTPDGFMYPCGSMCSFIPSRVVGSIFQESFASLAKKAYEDKHNTFISKYGIKPYYDYIQKNNLPIAIKDRFTDECHACYELFKDAGNILYLDNIVDCLDREFGK